MVVKWATFILTAFPSNCTDLSPPGWQRSPDCPFVCSCSTCICPCLALWPSWGAGRHCHEGFESWTSRSFHWSACSGVQTDPYCSSSCEQGFVACTSGSPQSRWVWSYRAGCSRRGWCRWCWHLVIRLWDDTAAVNIQEHCTVCIFVITIELFRVVLIQKVLLNMTTFHIKLFYEHCFEC